MVSHFSVFVDEEPVSNLEGKLSQSHWEPKNDSAGTKLPVLKCPTKSDNNLELIAESDICTTETEYFELPKGLSNEEVPGFYRKVLTCNICQQTFWYKSHMAQHLKKHTNQKMQQCQHCEKSFKHKHHLLRHMRQVHLT